MRMMLVQCSIEPFNTLVRNGTAGSKTKILRDIKPEGRRLHISVSVRARARRVDKSPMSRAMSPERGIARVEPAAM